MSVPLDPYDLQRLRLARALLAERAEVERLTKALTEISGIRDSIVGMQGFNFSEHAYPLVAVLDGAGFKGAGYEVSRKNLGTLIEQANAADAERDAALAQVEAMRKERDEWIAKIASVADSSSVAMVEQAERDTAEAIAAFFDKQILAYAHQREADYQGRHTASGARALDHAAVAIYAAQFVRNGAWKRGAR